MVGTGSISRAHGQAFLRHPDHLKLTAACDPVEPAARKFAAEFGPDAVVTTDHKELIRRGGFDAAILTLPHFLHYAIARDFVEAGIPVLVEKPLVCTLEEIRALRDLATARNVSLMAGQTRRFDAGVLSVKAWRDSGPEAFGELRTFDLVAQQNIYSYLGGKEKLGHWILDGAKAGGGVIISLAIHRLDLVRFLGGADYAEVSAMGRFDAPFHNGAESQATVLLKMSNGASGVLHANYLAPRIRFMESMCLHGTHGTISEIGGPLQYATQTGRRTEQWNDQFDGFTDATKSGAWEDSFVNQLVHFTDCVRAGRLEFTNSVYDNFNTIACIDAIARSLKTGQPVRVEQS